MKVKLRNKAYDNHSQTFVAFLEQKGSDEPTVVLQEKTGRTGGKWKWHLSTLLGLDGFSTGRVKDILMLDAGQDWYVVGMERILDEAEKVAEKKGWTMDKSRKGSMIDRVAASVL